MACVGTVRELCFATMPSHVARTSPPSGSPVTHVRARTVVLAIAPTIIILLFVVAVWLSLASQNRSRALVGHTRLVLLATEHALSTLKDAETGQRGFLLTGSNRYLQPYQSALDSLRIDIDSLRELTKDNARQQQNLDSLAVLVNVKLGELERTIALKRAGNSVAALAIVNSGVGERTMDAIRSVMADMQSEEWQRLAERDRTERQRTSFTLWLLVLGGLAAGAISFYLSRLLATHSRTMEAQTALIREQNQSMKDQMTELEAQTQELEEQQAELELANAALQERTQDAEAAEMRAREASETKSRFLATMSHELRTPLNAILGYTDLMDSGVEDRHANTDRSYLRRTRSAARHLLSLIDDVLSISKAGAPGGAQKPTLEPVRVGDLLHDVISVISPLAEQKQLRFEVQCDIDGQNVMIDRRRVRQILINVLGNAVKFTKEGDIRLTVACGDDTMTFKVRDSGQGIPEEHRERIFEPFWQAPHTQAGDRPSGVGLGLSVSRELARAMDGELSVEGADGGGQKGAEFTLTLPFIKLGD